MELEIDIARQRFYLKVAASKKLKLYLLVRKRDQIVDFNSLYDKLHLVAPSGESSYLTGRPLAL